MPSFRGYTPKGDPMSLTISSQKRKKEGRNYKLTGLNLYYKGKKIFVAEDLEIKNRLRGFLYGFNVVRMVNKKSRKVKKSKKKSRKGKKKSRKVKKSKKKSRKSKGKKKSKKKSRKGKKGKRKSKGKKKSRKGKKKR